MTKHLYNLTLVLIALIAILAFLKVGRVMDRRTEEFASRLREMDRHTPHRQYTENGTPIKEKP